MKTFSEYITENNRDREYDAAASAHADRISKPKSPEEEAENEAKMKAQKKITSKKIDFNGVTKGKNLLRYVSFNDNEQTIEFYGSNFGDGYNWTFDIKNKKAENGSRSNKEIIDFKDIDAKVIKAVETMYKELVKLYR